MVNEPAVDRYPVRPYGPARDRWRAVGRARPVPPSGRERASRQRRARTRPARVRVFRDPDRRTLAVPRPAAPRGRAPGRRTRGDGRASHVPSRWSSPSGWTRSSASPSGWPRPRPAGAVPDDRGRDPAGIARRHTTIRIFEEERLEVAAWAGICDEVADPAGVRPREGWVGEVLRSGRVAASRTSAATAARLRPLHGVLEFAGDLIAPLIHHDRVIGLLSASPSRRAPGPTATSPSSRRSPPTPRSRSPTPSSSSRPRPVPRSSGCCWPHRPG